MGSFKDLDENVNATCCLSYCTLKVLSLGGREFLKKKKSNLDLLILLVLVASKILQSNCLPYCSH